MRRHRGLEDKPVAGATVARLADVAAFLAGDFDDARCAALLAGLVWARPTRLPSTRLHTDDPDVPFAYAALKPIFTPDTALRGVGALTGTTRMPVPPGLIARLRTGDDERRPVCEEGPDVDASIAQRPIHLLHAMLGQRAHGLGQAAPHGMDCQRSARQHALGCVGQGQHPFGMQVAFVQGGDEVQDVVSPEPLPDEAGRS